MIIVYCETCGKRISDAEITESRAREVSENVWVCAKCSATSAPTSSSTAVPVSAPATRPKGTKSPTAANLRPKPAHTIKAKEALPRHVAMALLGAVCAGALVGIFVISQRSPAPQGKVAQATPPTVLPATSVPKAPVAVEQPPVVSAPPTKASIPVSQPPAERVREPEKPVENIRDQRAATVLEEHKTWFAKNPNQSFEFRERLRSLVSTYRSAPAAQEAERLIGEIKVAEVHGRIVRVELVGNQVLSLAEVQIFSKGTNVALKGTAKQSSDAYDARAARAIDGSTDGNFGANSTTHTNIDLNPWWEVELPEDTLIDSIAIWNRTDCCPDRLKDFKVSVLAADRSVVWSKTTNEFPNPKYVLEMK